MARRKAVRRNHTVGPPYFVGAFIVGFTTILTTVVSHVGCRITAATELDDHAEIKSFKRLMYWAIGECIIKCVGSFISVFFCATYGLRDCSAGQIEDLCHYPHTYPNRTLYVTIILILTVISTICSFLIVCLTRHFGHIWNISFCRKQGADDESEDSSVCEPVRYNSGKSMYVSDRHVVSDGIDNGMSPQYSERRPPHEIDDDIIPRRYATARPPVVLNDDTIPHQYAMVSEPPVQAVSPLIAPPHVLAVPSTLLAVPSNVLPLSTYPLVLEEEHNCHRSTIEALQEQNRLLQEQIRLQHKQINLQQRLQKKMDKYQCDAPPMYMPSPPPYEETISEDVAIRKLEEYNMLLKRQYQRQHDQLEMGLLSTGQPLKPSAPPHPSE